MARPMMPGVVMVGFTAPPRLAPMVAGPVVPAAVSRIGEGRGREQAPGHQHGQ
jgi:hypothetical protein